MSACLRVRVSASVYVCGCAGGGGCLGVVEVEKGCVWRWVTVSECGLSEDKKKKRHYRLAVRNSKVCKGIEETICAKMRGRKFQNNEDEDGSRVAKKGPSKDGTRRATSWKSSDDQAHASFQARNLWR